MKKFVAAKPSIVKKGESIVLSANIPHAIEAIDKFKMLLILVKKAENINISSK